MIAIADTSVLVASINRRDNDHERAVAALGKYTMDGVVVTAAVAVEVDFLVSARVGRYAARVFADDVDAGRYLAEPVDAAMFHRAIELDRQYADLNIGLTDGTVAAAAERHHAHAILSLDVHFLLIAPTFPVEPGPAGK